ncbi:hypothetical protein [Polaromonas sp. JS666]|uniref:hypothetical protein n=1 Tax=Polaromonas sp. (strain JS666 / ATCC BAA-500) TaxID=296591 RepID=UPI0000D5B4A9|nr:hypothetical protein [Polaromonas sp. JS666]ABE47242.1 hypothetical protein Bpro_5388 [Polaromonas sp. JS666]
MKTPNVTYRVPADGLAERIAGCVPKEKHHDLGKVIRAEHGLGAAKLVLTEAGSTRARERVITAAGDHIANDYESWLHTELAKDGGNAAETIRRLAPLGYLLTACQLTVLSFVHDRGGAHQDNFVQLTVWQEDEFLDRPAFDAKPWFSVRDHYDLQSAAGPHFSGEARARVRPSSYSLREVIDMKLFMAELDAVEADQRAVASRRRFELTDGRTGETEIKTYAEMSPGFDRYPSKERRLFNDWTVSSAGRSGARLCDHWVMKTWDRSGVKHNPHGDRSIGITPSWTFSSKLAEIKSVKSVYALLGKLETLDRRVKVPFGWYFFMLHGNRVRDWVGSEILTAAESGLVVLPEHDYRVLKAWSEMPYGF